MRGELIAAAVVLDDTSELDAAAIRAELKRDLSPYKVPATIAFFDSGDIPWTPTFKVRRHELTRMIVQRAGAAST